MADEKNTLKIRDDNKIELILQDKKFKIEGEQMPSWLNSSQTSTEVSGSLNVEKELPKKTNSLPG